MVYSINSLVSPPSMKGKETVVEETDGNIDLNLSLSLNGRFGVDPQRNRKVTGPSSHSNVLITPGQRSSAVFNENGAELKKWPSLPTGTEGKEMGIRRQELQSLALMDANKRRSLDSSSSSTISYFQNQTIEGHGFPANIGCSAYKNQGNSVQVVAENMSRKAKPAQEVNGRVFRKLEDMPHVFTTISGRKIKGFLSQYDKEGISIICACHCYSMTPAEFIKHAGGGNVANPERQIIIKHAVGDGEVVNPPN
ncbi:hypothetical protein POM88_039690 [Heracleum sosnowskyi]|uniref:Ninja-family protein n=1 Tax=Heracleum sosnowskyi TaxID=360622 RepID=A0AAD8M934_9APIA|nr:hypothetical protein POM88_039690 [Heracleum sosnowskyi]